MPLVGLEPAIPISEWPQTDALDCAASRISLSCVLYSLGLIFLVQLCDSSKCFVRQLCIKVQIWHMNDGLRVRIYNV
jgi:hypothetical protein